MRSPKAGIASCGISHPFRSRSLPTRRSSPGVTPPSHTVRDNGTFTVPKDEVTLAEVLRDAGYDTSAFIGSFPLESRFGLDQGFSTYDDELVKEDRPGSPVKIKTDIFFDERPASAVVDAAIAYHRKRAKTPFFTFLHFFDPHQPRRVPPPYDVEFRSHPYDGEIAFVDEQIGRFFAFLKERGDWEKTLVVLTADHGEGLGEHGELTHAILLHQATLHVPLIIAGPGVPKGEALEWTSSTGDYATTLELLGIPSQKDQPPVSPSLVPVMRGEKQGAFESYFETIAPRTSQGWAQLAGYMEGDFRFVHAPRPRLYNLAKDLGENENLADRRPELTAKLEQRLEGFLKSNERKSVAESFSSADKETMERLAALGYVRTGAGSMQGFGDMLAIDGLDDPRDRVVDISLFSEAKNSLMKGNIELARKLSLELIERSPGNPQGYQTLAIIAGQQGDYEECIDLLDKVLVLEPEDDRTRRLRGEVLIQMGRAKEGIAALEKMDDAGTTIETCTWLGKGYADLGRVDDAVSWFQRGIEIEPRQPWLQLYLANLYAGNGRLDEAERLYRKIIGESPYFALAYYNLGKLMLDEGRRDAARKLFHRSLSLNPGHRPSMEAVELLGESDS